MKKVFYIFVFCAGVLILLYISMVVSTLRQDAHTPTEFVVDEARRDVVVQNIANYDVNGVIAPVGDGSMIEFTSLTPLEIVLKYRDNRLIRSFSWRELVTGFNSLGGLPIEHQGVLYVINSGCAKTLQGIDCTGEQVLETSRDYGETWQRQPLPARLKQTFFIEHNDVLYQVFSSWCDNAPLGFFALPAHNDACGGLKIRRLSERGEWSEPLSINNTTGELFGVYPDGSSLLLVWRDMRGHSSRWCGFIPLIGCFDGSPTEGPYLIYAGLFDPKTMSLTSEYLLQQGYDFGKLLTHINSGIKKLFTTQR